MLLSIAAATLVAALFYYLIIKPYDYWKDQGVPQGKPYWIVGDNWGTVFRLQSVAEMVKYLYDQCPGTRYSGMYQFLLPMLIVKDPNLIKQLTVKDFDHFTDHRTVIPEDVENLWAKNLFSLKGQKWRDMRIILSPSFTTSKMRAMFVLIAECAENFVQHFLDRDEEIITLEMKDTFTRFTNDVIATTAFGVKVDSLDKPNNEFYLMGKEATDFSGFRKILKIFCFCLFPKMFNLFKFRFFDQKVSLFFRNLVDDTIKMREEKGIVRPDMIHLLMEARKGTNKHEVNGVIDTGFATAQESDLGKVAIPRDITNEDITAQALIFFFAGFDTVSTLMCFLCYELTVNPDVQEKLREEVLATLKECNGKITYEGLLKMKYMDMVVSESLRKWPNPPVMDRVCTKPYTIEATIPGEKPVHLKEGTALFIPTFALHRDPAYFPNPERFDPERFSDENKSNIKPYTYYPFGVGPRNCIGSRFALMETKAVVCYILASFQVIPVEKTQIPLRLSRKTFNMTADGGFWIGLKRLKHI